MQYEIIIQPPAKKFFKKLKDKKLKELYMSAIRRLADGEDIGEKKTGDLKGISSYDIYYNRTNYELAYIRHEIGNKVVVVISAGTRENFYDELRRYIFR